jgi:hypothetical protein
MTGIANCLVTATPNTPGFPTLSGTTNSEGVLSLPFNNTITYSLTFTGTALGTVSNFTPAKTTFTFYTLKNRGTKGIKVSGQSLAAGGTVFAAHQSLPVSIKSQPFVSWSPNALFTSPKASKTNLKMPSSSVSIAQISTAVASFLVTAGWFVSNGSVGAHSKYTVSANTWTSIPDVGRGSIGGAGVKPKFYVNGKGKASAYDISTKVWATLPSPLKNMPYPALAASGSIVYALGKSAGTNPKKLSKYLVSKNSYVQLKSSLANQGNTTSAMAASNGRLYTNYRQSSPYTQSFDIATSVWATKAVGESRNLDAWGIGKGVFYVNSGWSHPVHGSSYTISKNSWKAAPAYTTLHWRNQNRGNGLVGSNFYIIGGDTSANQTTHNVVYDVVSRTFSSKASLNAVAGRGALGQL